MAKVKKNENADMNPALLEAIDKMNKKHGEGSIMHSSDEISSIDVIPSGSFMIDDMLGCGGLPRGRIIEVYGAESSGKSTLCLFFASQVQKNGGTVAYIDAENAYDPSYAKNIGVDTQKLLVSQPDTLEESMDIVRALAETQAVDLIVVDSVAAMTPKKELEGEEMLKDSMAVQAQLMAKALRILTGPVSRSNTVVIFINQLREKIGVFFGSKDTTPGGKALKFYSSVRLSVTRGEKITGSAGEQIGNVMNISAVKNKVGAPWKKATVTLYYGRGVDLGYDLFHTGVARGLITKTGNSYSLGETKLGVGEGQAVASLNENEAIRTELKTLLSK